LNQAIARSGCFSFDAARSPVPSENCHLRIKKFRLAEAAVLVFMAVGTIVGSTLDWQTAQSGQSTTSLGLSVPAAYLAALGELALAFWLGRDAIRRRE
jgi:hypothetical protein